MSAQDVDTEQVGNKPDYTVNGIPKRTEGEVDRDLEVISQLYLRGKRAAEIAQELVKRFGYASLSANQVMADLRKLRAMWVQSALINYDEAKAREIAHVDELESTAWEAWNKSWGKERTLVQEGIEDQYGHKGGPEENGPVVENKKPSTYIRKSAKETTKDMMGDPRYLDTIKWCIEQRCKILGLHEPMRLAVTWQQEATKFGVDPEAAQQMYNKMVADNTKLLRDQWLKNNEIALPAETLDAEFAELDEEELPDDLD